jgi:hypothetical protein
MQSVAKKNVRRDDSRLAVDDIVDIFMAELRQKRLETNALEKEKELNNDTDNDNDVKIVVPPPRYFIETKKYLVFIVVGILICFTILSVVNIVWVAIYENTPYFIGFVMIVPMGMIFFSFAMMTVITSLFFAFAASNRALDQNSQFYSAIKTPIPLNAKLPFILVQMPVYKEGLEGVIKQSFFNVKKAMDYYEAQGGRTKYMICDDGLMLIPDEDKIARIKFYRKNDISFVARPAANRRGIFKKASNMNYTLSISLKIAEFMENEGHSHKEALHTIWTEKNQEFVAHGDMSIPNDSLILLIDADTKIPQRAMYDVVGEFLEDESVAYTQHFTEPFEEQQNNYWEQMISFFTKKIYFVGIASAVCLGDTSPLVGHNAFLRWASVKKVAFQQDGVTKFWSEDRVSEDFDMFIRLASINQFGRYVMYTGSGFQEGVSLTYSDEIIKFKKFAYGGCELIFNKFKDWRKLGIICKDFSDYLRSEHIQWFQKVSMFAYLSSYLAMASALPFALIEGIVSIIRPDIHDKYMVRSFDVMLTCTFIFAIVATFGNVMLIWRIRSLSGDNNILWIIWNEIKWIPHIAIFFNSMLFHMSSACYMYFLDRPVVWGATVKEVENVDCKTALKQTLTAYKKEYIFFTILLVVYSLCLWYFQLGVYRGWSVVSYCVAHLLGPILLNPYIMSLSH